MFFFQKFLGQSNQKQPPTHTGYPDDIKKEAVELACELNNNREAARRIAKKYASQGLYQQISEKSVREWRMNKKYNSKYEEDFSNKKRVQKKRSYREIS